MNQLITAMLTKEPRRRPNINDILKMPIIEKRISQFLKNNDFRDEFSHTLLHNKDVFKDFQKRQEGDVRRQQQLEEEKLQAENAILKKKQQDEEELKQKMQNMYID